MPRGIRALLAMAFAAFAVAASAIAAPAHAATYPKQGFHVAYGNSYTTGITTWYNRSLAVEGEIRATAGNCRWVEVRTYKSNGALLASDGGPLFGLCNYDITTKGAWFWYSQIPADVPGGAAYINICLMGRSVFDPVSETLTCKRYNNPSHA